MSSKFLGCVAAVAMSLVVTSSASAAGHVVTTIMNDLFIETLATSFADPATNTQGVATDASWTSSVAIPNGAGWVHVATLDLGVSAQIGGFLWANAADFVNEVQTPFPGPTPAVVFSDAVVADLGSAPPVGVVVTSANLDVTVDAAGFVSFDLSNILLGTIAVFGDAAITGLRVGVIGIGGTNVNPGTITVVSTLIPEPTSGLFLASLAAGAGAVVRRRRRK